MRSSPGDLRNHTPWHGAAKPGRVLVYLVRRLLGPPTPMILRSGWFSAEPPAQGLNKGWGPRKLLLLLLGVFLLFQSPAQAHIREVRRVLIINDIGAISSPGYAEIDQALFTGLQESPYRIELYEESLDLILFPGRVWQDRFREEIIQKYSARKPDVIIAAGPESLKFIAKMYDKFQGTPVVFCTIWSGMPDQLRHGMPFTGVLAQLRPEGTLSVALHLLPNTKHVVIVGGVGKFDEGWEAIAKQSFHNYESKLEFTYLFDLTMPALLERLKHLPSDTIVYHTAISQDSAGDHFIDSAQSIPMVTSAANAPVFVMDDVDLRAGTVGGYLVNWADDARIAAEIAVRVLNGEKPQDIPVVTSNHAYMFDWRALQRWGLKESNLPPGSIVLNRQPTVWEAYKSYIIGVAFLFILQALMIFGLLWQRAERLKSEKAVRESERRFRLVANTAPVMIWMSGSDKLCNYFNQPWLDFTGRSLEADLGNGWSEGVHPEDLKDCLGTYKRAFDLRESYRTQYRLRRHDGEYRWVLAIGVPRLNLDGSFAGYIGSCIDITDHKLAEEALANVGRRLIEAHEEERTWIARELHDDINQRIALLGVQLEQWAQDPPDSGVEFTNHIRRVCKSFSDLGRDIQALSHHLHSSKLEYLGIVAAASSFCKELSEQQKVEIDFIHAGIPDSLPKEISLCLFRVLQEALQNAVKHSGERHFKVELSRTSAQIQLTVNDVGVGFDPQDAINRRGLGLISMRERLRLMNGEMFIKSELGHGTTINACVPLREEAHCARAAG
jgi:PAS domain S-box-containing protein